MVSEISDRDTEATAEYKRLDCELPLIVLPRGRFADPQRVRSSTWFGLF
jgi:hypothetical protein